MMRSLSLSVTYPLVLHTRKSEDSFAVNTHTHTQEGRNTLTSLHCSYLSIHPIDCAIRGNRGEEDRHSKNDNDAQNSFSINQDRVTHFAPKGW